MRLKTEHLARCIQTLATSLDWLRRADEGSVEYEVYRNAVVKGFELSLETAGKLIRRALKAYAIGTREIDAMTYKDLLRHAARHGLLTADEVERWFAYRDNRNDTAHDYGVAFAEDTLGLLPDFLADVRRLEGTLRERFGNADA